MKYTLTAITIATLTLTISAANAVEESTGDSPVTFPVAWMDELLFAYEDFLKTDQDLSCFVVDLEGRGDSLFITFSDNVDNPPTDANGKITVQAGDGGECGYSLVYEFDHTGKFIGKSGIR